MNQFERNDNHIEIVCVINHKFNAQIINMFSLNRWSYVCICNYPPFAKVSRLNDETSYEFPPLAPLHPSLML